MLARLRLLRKSSRQMHRLDHQAGARALGSPTPSTPTDPGEKSCHFHPPASGPSASCSAPHLVERLPRDRPHCPCAAS